MIWLKDLRVLKIFERTLDDQRDFDYEELIFTSSKFKILFDNKKSKNFLSSLPRRLNYGLVGKYPHIISASL